MKQEKFDEPEGFEEEKPWQGMIEMTQEMIDDWIGYGFDKERPEQFQKMQDIRDGFKEKQLKALKPQAFKATESPSIEDAAAEGGS